MSNGQHGRVFFENILQKWWFYFSWPFNPPRPPKQKDQLGKGGPTLRLFGAVRIMTSG